MQVTTSGFRATENAATRQAVERLGGVYSQDLTESTAVLIMKRAVRSSEKLKAARRMHKIYAVTIQWLKDSLAQKSFLPPEPYLMRPLEGVAIFFGTSDGREEAARLGARIVASVEEAEVVVCAEIFDPLVEISRRRGLSAFPVSWVFDCGTHRLMLDSGEYGKISDHLLVANAATLPSKFTPCLLGQVISLALVRDLVERKRLRDLARRLGAFTTENLDNSISIFLVPVSPLTGLTLAFSGGAGGGGGGGGVGSGFHVKSSWLEQCSITGNFVEISEYEVTLPKEKIVRTQSFLLPKDERPSEVLAVPRSPVRVLARASLTGAQGIFSGKKFGLVGFTGPDEQTLIYQLTSHGAEISDHAVHAIVCNDSFTVPVPLAGGPVGNVVVGGLGVVVGCGSVVVGGTGVVGVVVSRRWVRACIEEEKILDINGNLLFRPSKGKLPLPLVRDVHIFHAEKEGEEIRELCAVLGFKMSAGKNVTVKNITHFVFGNYLTIARRPDLIDLAEKRGIKAVTVEWLKKCFTSAARVEETPFAVKRGTQGNIEAFFSERQGCDGAVFTGKTFSVSKEVKELEDIIKNAGGIIEQKSNFPDYLVSTQTDHAWVLECIEQNRILDRTVFAPSPKLASKQPAPLNKVTWDPTKTHNQLNTPIKSQKPHN